MRAGGQTPRPGAETRPVPTRTFPTWTLPAWTLLAALLLGACQITGVPPSAAGEPTATSVAAAATEPPPGGGGTELDHGGEQLTRGAALAYALGMERLAAGLHEDALDSFLEALELQDEPSPLLETRAATMLQQLGRHPEAVEHLDRAIGVHDSANLRARRAWAHRETGDCTAAAADAEAGIRIPLPDPTAHSHAEARLILAECRLEDGDAEQSLRDARAALEEARRAGGFGPGISRFQEMVERLERPAGAGGQPVETGPEDPGPNPGE